MVFFLLLLLSGIDCIQYRLVTANLLWYLWDHSAIVGHLNYKANKLLNYKSMSRYVGKKIGTSPYWMTLYNTGMSTTNHANFWSRSNYKSKTLTMMLFCRFVIVSSSLWFSLIPFWLWFSFNYLTVLDKQSQNFKWLYCKWYRLISYLPREPTRPVASVPIALLVLWIQAASNLNSISWGSFLGGFARSALTLSLVRLWSSYVLWSQVWSGNFDLEPKGSNLYALLSSIPFYLPWKKIV